MKYKFVSLLLLFSITMAGCLKDTPAVDFSTVGTVVEILPVNGGGLENFGAAELQFDPEDQQDSADIDLNIASPDALRAAYNTANGTDYDPMPDSVYSMPVKSGNIAAGDRLDTIRVIFYPAKIDTTKSYMLPVSISNADGQTISGNFGAIYFHTNAR